MFKVKFRELNSGFKVKFAETHQVTDGGYERGYAAGYEVGNSEGYTKGHTDGLEQGYAEGVASVPDFLAMRVSNTLIEYENDTINTIADYAFYYCSNLERVDFPNCTHVGNYAFQYCSALKEAKFPLVISLGGTYSYSFSRCSKLEKIDFGRLETMGGYAFQLCNALKTLIIRTPAVCTLQGVSAINSSAINSGEGYIYVPDHLVEEYKAATNWSTFADQIKSISELEGET